ncbi:MAG TPA: cytochrome o ubiquinol oxidase subunit I, partial [Stellaceae bacterium]|nr:cytochrome o ubiquinol oxidase subunit I [Stellaceae bacterium]
MLGRLNWSAIPFDEPIAFVTAIMIVIGGAAILGLVTFMGWWGYLWREYITSVDHKRIGVMYVLLAMVMLLRGFADAIMMRTQQVLAVGDSQG